MSEPFKSMAEVKRALELAIGEAATLDAAAEKLGNHSRASASFCFGQAEGYEKAKDWMTAIASRIPDGKEVRPPEAAPPEEAEKGDGTGRRSRMFEFEVEFDDDVDEEDLLEALSLILDRITDGDVLDDFGSVAVGDLYIQD